MLSYSGENGVVEKDEKAELSNSAVPFLDFPFFSIFPQVLNYRPVLVKTAHSEKAEV